MYHLEIDRFADMKSPVHTWDPRVKIPVLLVAAFTIGMLRDIRLAGVGLGFSIGMVAVSRIPISFVLRRLRWVFLFLTPFVFIMPLTVPGRDIWRHSFMSVSYEGLALAAPIFLKAIAIVLLIFPMMGTAPFHISMKALQQLRIPIRFVQIILFTYRYIFVFLEEIRRMNDAAKTRGFEVRTRWHTFRTLGNFIGVLLVRSFERTERLYNAMISRGYTGKLVTLSSFRMTLYDIVKGVVTISVCILILFAQAFL
jgi:cobalt/nickel transport system permease protein